MAMASSRHPLVKIVLRYLLALGNDCVEKIERLFFSKKKTMNKKKYDIQCIGALLEFLKEYKEVFKISKQGYSDTVVPTTALSVCKQHCKKSGSCAARCENLHTCVYFLLSGECVHGDRCHFGHKMTDQHNRSVLENRMLSGLNLTELRILFSLPWVRRGVLVPKVCRYYNGAKGCNRPDCRCLHICRFYYSPGDTKCRFGRNCKRNHDIQDVRVQDVLKLYGFETARPVKDLLEELRRLPADDDDDFERRSNDSDDDSDDRSNDSDDDDNDRRSRSRNNDLYSTFRDSSPDLNDRWQVGGPFGRMSRERLARSSTRVSPSRLHHGFAPDDRWQTAFRRERNPWSTRQDEDSYRNQPATSRGRSAGHGARTMSRYMERSRSRSSSREQEQRRRMQAFGDTADRFNASRMETRERSTSGERRNWRERSTSGERRNWRERSTSGERRDWRAERGNVQRRR